MPIGLGIFFTSVNVHNPWRKEAKYAVKIAISKPNGEAGPIAKFQDHLLGPDATTEYDYIGFNALLNGLPPFYEGFFVIESFVELDVVGIYTGSAIQNKCLGAMHMERVPARIIPLLKKESELQDNL